MTCKPSKNNWYHCLHQYQNPLMPILPTPRWPQNYQLHSVDLVQLLVKRDFEKFWLLGCVKWISTNFITFVNFYEFLNGKSRFSQSISLCMPTVNMIAEFKKKSLHNIVVRRRRFSVIFTARCYAERGYVISACWRVDPKKLLYQRTRNTDQNSLFEWKVRTKDFVL